MHDLKSLNLDLLEVNSAGLVLVSKIVCNKLPRHFLIELFRETGTNYPSFNLLLQVYQSILTRLQVNIKDNSSKGQDNQVNISSSNKGAKPKMVNKSSNEKPTSDNKSSEAKVKSSKCRFCGSPEHTAINCDAYPSVEARVSLADKKGWCTKCLSGKHLLDSCPGKSASLPFKCYKCKKAEHHAVVHPTKNFASKSNSKGSFNYQSNPGVMNPVLSFSVGRDKSRAKFVFLSLELSLAQFVKRQLKSMSMSVAVLLWLDLCVLLAKIGGDGLKDTIILPSLLYLVDRKSMLIFLPLKICLFS